MALGDQGNAQQIVVRAKGWDPNKIDEGGGDVTQTNKRPDPGQYRGTPALGGFDEGKYPVTEEALSDGTPFNHPDVRSAIPSLSKGDHMAGKR